jgi:glycosyltransferase involved in cell wall biosynthesis
MPFPWTTHFAYYMSPLKMFEYMAAKRPIIATDLPAIREILDDKMAIIIPPGDPEALAEAVKRLLDDPIQAEKLSDQAYAKVQEYTWAKRVLAIVDFLRD